MLAKSCAGYLASEDRNDASEGRRILINVLDNWHKLPESSHQLWIDLVEAAGFYPYLNHKVTKNVNIQGTGQKIRVEFHKSDFTGKYFHDEQKRHNDILMHGEKNLIVSAPTSFGKSLLIQEVVASLKYKNIVIIQPTLALLDETRRKLKEYRNNYKIIVRTTQKPSEEKGNLFLLTAERVMEYQDFPEIDFFVIDEFYKLSPGRDRDRSDVLNNACNMLLNKYHAKFYLLGPNVAGIPNGFKEKYNAIFMDTNYTLVENTEVDKTSSNYRIVGGPLVKQEALFDLLVQLRDEQSIIYCASPRRVRELSRSFYYYLLNQIERNNIALKPREPLSLIEWINTNIGNKWSLSKCLSLGIGIHDAALQKHITSSIINYFNTNRMTYLFCTTTIIEGVNTSAKNVVYFDYLKGSNRQIDYFDYCNIKGRAGRLMEHYVGRIYNFNDPPQREPIKVDIPFFDQIRLSDEILINLEPSDVFDKESEQYTRLSAIPEAERALFKKNGLLISGQQKILEFLKANIFDVYHLIRWETFPTFGQLYFVLNLAWNLLRPGESRAGIRSPWALTGATNKYRVFKDAIAMVYNTYDYLLSRSTMEGSKFFGWTDEELFDEALRQQFLILRTWFHYKVPKWLNVMNNLQEYVCALNDLVPGNYTYFAQQIENDFVDEKFAILVEYGIPTSAIRKISAKLSLNFDEDKVVDALKNKDLLDNLGLTTYEKEKVIESL
jgi:hypothetical protein